MKNLSFFAAVFICCTAVFADDSQDSVSPLFNWSLLLSGSWEESRTLHNRAEIKLDILPLDLLLRMQVLDRRTLNFELEEPLGDPDKWITNYTGGLYHRPTGSRLLFGVIDEWGLPARIRNPWIRSPPYTENHSSISADLRTTASSTREDMAYLYLSSPVLELFPNIKLRSFISTQTEIYEFTPTLSGGFDFTFVNNTRPRDSNRLLLEAFYTGKTLPPRTVNTWFSDPPPLPERDFDLYAAGLFFSNPAFSVSSDFALSETFSWGTDVYGNFGITLTPLLPIGNRPRPLAFSFAADGSGERFVNIDGIILNDGFRGAAKIEWRGRYNYLIRLNTVLRSDAFGEDFNRSSTGFYCRFPNSAAIRNNNVIRLTRISLSADRNAVNPQKINDSFSGTLGLNINNILGVNISGSIKGLGESDNPSPYPVFDDMWLWDTTSVNCDFILSPGIFQFRSGIGCTFFEEKDKKWDFSVSASARFMHGRLSLKAASEDFDRWNWTVSYRLEMQGNK